MKSPPFEVIYIDGGQVYRSQQQRELSSAYTQDDNADPVFKETEANGKAYLATQNFQQYFGIEGGANLDGYDLCPAVTLWICLGAKPGEERQNYDLFFAFDSVDQLRKTALHYGLPYPITEELGAQIEAAPENYCYLNTGRPIVLAAVKFVLGKPALLKLYAYPKPHGSWDVWMYGASYFNGGQCFESGAVYTKLTGGEDLPGAQMRGQGGNRKAEVIYSERCDGVCTSYAYTRGKDPAIFWEGREIDSTGAVLRVKHYESSGFVRLMIGRVKNGPTYQDRNLCPDVRFWLGRSWYDDADEEELLFAVTGSAMLESVAAYYGLPAPFNAEQKQIIDSKPELYRARHYDLLGAGPGGFVPVVVAGIAFKGGAPHRLLLYTFLRQWEFEDAISLPQFK